MAQGESTCHQRVAMSLVAAQGTTDYLCQQTRILQTFLGAFQTIAHQGVKRFGHATNPWA